MMIRFVIDGIAYCLGATAITIGMLGLLGTPGALIGLGVCVCVLALVKIR